MATNFILTERKHEKKEEKLIKQETKKVAALERELKKHEKQPMGVAHKRK